MHGEAGTSCHVSLPQASISPICKAPTKALVNKSIMIEAVIIKENQCCHLRRINLPSTLKEKLLKLSSSIDTTNIL